MGKQWKIVFENTRLSKISSEMGRLVSVLDKKQGQSRDNKRMSGVLCRSLTRDMNRGSRCLRTSGERDAQEIATEFWAPNVLEVCSQVVPQHFSFLILTRKFPSHLPRSENWLGLSDFCQLLVIFTEKAMAPHSSALDWKIPWTEETGRLQSMGLLRVRHD